MMSRISWATIIAWSNRGIHCRIDDSNLACVETALQSTVHRSVGISDDESSNWRRIVEVLTDEYLVEISAAAHVSNVSDLPAAMYT
jgi:hypothetical protein